LTLWAHFLGLLLANLQLLLIRNEHISTFKKSLRLGE
jgi:hypothetical protein